MDSVVTTSRIQQDFSKRLLLILLAIGVTVSAQTPDQSKLPLVQLADLQYQGAFRVPDAPNGESFEFGGKALAFNPAGPSLFMSNRQNRVAEISIPSTPIDSTNVNDLPVATLLQGFADPTEGHLHEIGSDGLALGSLVVQNGKLVGTGWIYYDANNAQRVSHYTHSLQLNQASFSGWSSVWDAAKTGYVSGYLANIPAEWQVRLGGPTLTGQCCVPIVSRTSLGPSAFAFDPSTIGQPLVPASPLLYYTMEHPTLGPWDITTEANEVYGMSTGVGGVAVIAGTRAALFVGRSGIGKPCYGEGTANPALVGTPDEVGHPRCFDPVNNYKGTHAYPYRYQVWAYDLNDFAAVKAGAKQPWEIKPYAVWELKFPIPQKDVSLGGVAYDPATQRLFVSQMVMDAVGFRPLVHVFTLNAAAPAVITPTTPAVVVTLTPDVNQQILVLEARIATIKALIQQALNNTTAAKAVVPLKSALQK